MTTVTSRSTLAWDNLLGREDIVGGQLELDEATTTTRGPITKVFRGYGVIWFRRDWVALQTGIDQWHFVGSPFGPFVGTNEDLGGSPQMQPDGTITFTIHTVGKGTIYPKGHPDRLDSDDVGGLLPAT